MIGDVLAVLALIACNGVFAAAEMALVTTRTTRLKELAAQGSLRARRVLALRQHPERLLATIQVGITAVGTLASAVGGASLAEPLAEVLVPLLAQLPGHAEQSAGAVALGVVVGGISYVSLIIGELVPKSLAMRHAEALALWMATPVQGLAWLARPAVWFLTKSSNLVLKPFGDHTSFSESRLSVDELRVLIEEGTRAGTVDARTGDIATRALELSSLTAGEMAVPRARVVGVDLKQTGEQVRRVFAQCGHHRLLVLDGSPDAVTGFISANDTVDISDGGDPHAWRARVRPVLFIPETTRAPNLLRQMQEKRARLAVVVDEHGGMAGVLTLEDLFEELVGDLYSESEEAAPAVKETAPGTFLLAAGTPLREFERVTGVRVPDDVPADTVAGLVLHLAGEIPGEGAVFRGYGASWRVVARTERRIKQVEVVRDAAVS